MIPYDPRKPLDPSGIRVGTPALTSRGLGVAEMDQIADLIHTVLANTTPAEGSKAKFTLDPALADRISKQATELLAPFPLYPAVTLD
jgi:glycine hydroxymethyltransferase